MAAAARPGDGPSHPRLEKQLRLVDVYAIATGAMFSSGFFLLPGIASAESGPIVPLAYLLAGLMILPAMLSAAELSTAMPRAGGPYYFLDRSMGPLFGTVAGFGTWLGLVFKSAFALVGMSAYIALFVDLPIQPVAVGLTVVFALLNIVGVRKTSRLQIVLVGVLLGVLGYFVVAGLAHVTGQPLGSLLDRQFSPLLPFGVEGVVATTGLVFVSYAGLTQVASVSEEVENPNRNIPLGMLLSLLTATAVYVVGVFVMVAVLDPAAMHEDLTPVATAAEAYLPMPFGLVLVVAAAVAAFASTGNAGILSAARYPFAMARDRLLWGRLAEVGRFATPTSAIITTGVVMVVFILALDVRAIAGLASAFMLLIFGLMNLAVIVMRESRISAYDPGFRSPLYPWTQLAGIAISGVLVVEIGLLEAGFSAALIAASVTWYFAFARPRVARDGAIYHIFARLGQRRDTGLDRELAGILQEQGIREEDRFPEVVARAAVVDLPAGASYEQAVRAAAARLAPRLQIDEQALAARFVDESPLAAVPVSRGSAMPHVLLSGVEHPELAIVRAPSGVRAPAVDGEQPPGSTCFALFFVVGDKSRGGQVLRILAQIAAHVDHEGFVDRWNSADTEQDLKEVLLEEERFLSLRVRGDAPSAELIGQRLRDLDIPSGCLVALVRRSDGRTIVPRGSTELLGGDRITVIGDPDGIRTMADRYDHRGK